MSFVTPTLLSNDPRAQHSPLFAGTLSLPSSRLEQKSVERIAYDPEDFPVLPGVYASSPLYMPRYRTDGSMTTTDLPKSDHQSFSSVLSFSAWLASGKQKKWSSKNTCPFQVSDFNATKDAFLRVGSSSHQVDQLGLEFVRPENAYQIHCLLNQYIFDQTNGRFNIPRQSLDELALVMSGAYENYMPYRTGDMKHDLKQLNLVVLDAIAPSVLNHLNAQLNYIPTIDYVPAPLPRPEYVTAKDEHKLLFDMTRRYGEMADIYRTRDRQVRQVNRQMMGLPPPQQRVVEVTQDKTILYPSKEVLWDQYQISPATPQFPKPNLDWAFQPRFI